MFPALSFRWKTILGIAGIESILLILLLSLTLGQMQKFNSAAINKRATTVATLFATTSTDATLSYDLASLESFAGEVMKNPDLQYARILSTTGDVLVSAGSTVHMPEQFTADSSLSTVTDGVYDSTANIVESGMIYAKVQIGIDTGRITSDLAELTRWSYLLATLELVLVALFSWILGTYLTRQLHEVRGAARKIAENNLDVNLEVRSKDEIGEVASSFNAMVSNLLSSQKERQRYERELKSLNVTLENRVTERTAELESSVDKLRAAQVDLESEAAERRKIEFEMRHAQKMEAIGHIAAGVANEITTPVRYIGDNMKHLRDALADFTELNAEIKAIALNNDASAAEKAELIKELENRINIRHLSDSAPAAIERANKGVERVSEIVNAMKSFGAGRNIERRLSDVNQAVSQALIVTRHEHKLCARVKTQLAEDLPEIYHNGAELTQVMMLLILNATRAITKHHGGGDKGRIQIQTRKTHQEEIQIAVTDNGCGITAQERRQIFEDHFSSSEETDTTVQGLAIARDMIENGHGGKILVDSTPDKGSTFTISLPVNPAKFRSFLVTDNDVSLPG